MPKFNNRRLGALTIAIAAALAASTAHAQWSVDPANNLMVAAHTAGDQDLPHMVATPDGGFYISWLDAGAGYSVRLQRLDADGNLQWGPTGILVYARTEQFVYDYGLTVDTAGNAVLSFDAGQLAPSNTLPGGNILVSKVAPDGSFVWGAAGIQVSPPGEIEYLGKVAATSDGGVAVAWFDANNNVKVKKFDANGVSQWSGTPSFGGFLADIRASDNGSAIIAVRTGAGALITQKLAAADGSAMWGASALVLSDGTTTTGGLSNGAAPPFISDGAGGAVYAWSVCLGVSSCTSRVQHVSAAGVRLFADNSFNGVDVSANNAVDGTGIDGQVIPSAVYDAATGDIYVMWEEGQQTSNFFAATFAQRIDSAGTRQWTDDGKQLDAFIPNGVTTVVSQLVVGSAPNGFLAAWSNGTSQFPQTKIHVQRLDVDGNYVWSPVPVDIKTSSAETDRLIAATSTNGFAAYAWVDNDAHNGIGDLRAQNIRYDGLPGKLFGTPPGAPTLAAGSDSGDSASDNLTNVASPTFTGTCTTNGDSIGIASDGTIAGTGGVCSGGVYTTTLSTALSDGVHAIKAFEYSAAGASTYSSALNITIDTTPPAITLTSNPANPAGSSDASFGFTIDDVRPTQCKLDSGTFAPCTSPVIYAGLVVGSHTFTVSATDAAGNVGTTVYTWTVVPEAVVVSLDPSTDSGRSNSDLITNADPLIFTGPCTDGDSIQLFAGSPSIGTAICAGGTYTISAGGLTQGSKNITGKATRSGFTGPSGASYIVKIDRTAPAAPTLSGPAGSVVTSATFSGTAEINASVSVLDAGTTAVCSAIADGGGHWTCTGALSGDGSHSVTATATDVAGNVSPASTAITVTVDSSDVIFRNGFDGP
jgi:hypothetical protein